MGNLRSMIFNHNLPHCSWNISTSFYLEYACTDLQTGQVNEALLNHILTPAAYTLAAILTTITQSTGYAKSSKQFLFPIHTPLKDGSGTFWIQKMTGHTSSTLSRTGVVLAAAL
jgi:hypothetical protein